MIIAIDGPAASGKGTLAKRIAAHFGFALLDTGLLYRAVGLKTLNQGRDPSDAAAAAAAAESLDPAELENPELRHDAAAGAASKVGRDSRGTRGSPGFSAAFRQPPAGGGRRGPFSTAATSAPSSAPMPTPSCS